MKTTKPVMTKIKTNPWSPGVCCFWGVEIVWTFSPIDFSSAGKHLPAPEVYTPSHTHDAEIGFQSLAAKHFGADLEQERFGKPALKCLAAKHSSRRPTIRTSSASHSPAKCLAAKLLLAQHPFTPTSNNSLFCSNMFGASIAVKRTPVANTRHLTLLEKSHVCGSGAKGSEFFLNFPIQEYEPTRFSEYYLDACFSRPVSRVYKPRLDNADDSQGNCAVSAWIRRHISRALISELPAADGWAKSLAAKQMDICHPMSPRYRRPYESICLAAKHGHAIGTGEAIVTRTSNKTNCGVRPKSLAAKQMDICPPMSPRYRRPYKSICLAAKHGHVVRTGEAIVTRQSNKTNCGVHPKSLAAKHALRTELPARQISGKAQMERTMNTS